MYYTVSDVELNGSYTSVHLKGSIYKIFITEMAIK